MILMMFYSINILFSLIFSFECLNSFADEDKIRPHQTAQLFTFIFNVWRGFQSHSFLVILAV